jgi:hypothetical protein
VFGRGGAQARIAIGKRAGSIAMVSDSERANWRKAFELLGPATLLARLEKERAGMPPEYVREAYAWLLEQDNTAERRDEIHYQTMRRLTLIAAWGGAIAAVAGVIAAATGVLAVWPKH